MEPFVKVCSSVGQAAPDPLPANWESHPLPPPPAGYRLLSLRVNNSNAILDDAWQINANDVPIVYFDGQGSTDVTYYAHVAVGQTLVFTGTLVVDQSDNYFEVTLYDGGEEVAFWGEYNNGPIGTVLTFFSYTTMGQPAQPSLRKVSPFVKVCEGRVCLGAPLPPPPVECVYGDWLPTTDAYCEGISFAQTRTLISGAGCPTTEQREAVGTLTGVVCNCDYTEWDPPASYVCNGVEFYQTRWLLGENYETCLGPFGRTAIGTGGDPVWSEWYAYDDPAWYCEGYEFELWFIRYALNCDATEYKNEMAVGTAEC